MKYRLGSFSLLFLVLSAVVLVFLCGCQSTPVQVRPARTNVVEVVRTNTLQVVQTNLVSRPVPGVAGGPDALVTNAVVLTNLVTSLTTNVVTLVTPPVYYTNLSLSPWVETAAKVGGAVAPTPWGAAGSLVVGILGTLLAVVNERRRRKALGQAMTWEQTAGVLVENVETVRKAALQLPGYTPAMDLHLVRSLEAAQRLAGVKDVVHRLVEERTEDTIRTVPNTETW